MYLNSSEHTRTTLHWLHVPFFARVQSTWHNAGDGRFLIAYKMCSVSVANNFVHCQTGSDYGNQTFGELARFIYCLLQKIKLWSSLPLGEQWDDYVLPNHSKFVPIADGEIPAGTRVLAALNKIGSLYLKQELQRDARRFLEEFTTSVLSTVAAGSKIGQGLSCFCPSIILGGDNHAPLHLLDLLLDGLLDNGWVKGSEIEACRSEYQSFVQEQRQLEQSSTRSRPDIGDVLSFCSSQAGFRARQHLFKVCIVTNMVKLRDRYVGKYWSCFPGVPANSSYFARTSDLWRAFLHYFGSSDDLRRRGAQCNPLCAGFYKESAFHPAELLFGLRARHVSWVCIHLWQDHAQRCFRAMEPRGDYISFSGCGWRVRVREWGSWSTEGG